MGLLDDAIREHLELKRLRGADPGEVARAEDDALGPVRREAEVPAPASEHENSDSLGNGGDSEAEVGAPAADTPTARSDLGAGGRQETVEINMEAELGRQSTSSETSAPPAGGPAAPVGHPAHRQPNAGDSLEWEMPGDRKSDAEGERSAEESQALSEEPVEDVLEETPDFLRETPEQDRLWFEQRPPRDFDFNE